ncbi:MAG: hypothetical protein IKA36_05020 [Clostridia bacterium]|nr:hypothetical protein [Clostridia bacterium]
MLIKELLQQLENLDKQQAEIKQKKKNLILKAKTDRVLEVQLSDLIIELQQQSPDSKYVVKINPIYIPNSIFNKMDEVKNYIIKNITGLGIRIEDLNHYQINISIKDTMLSNNEYLVDHLEFDHKNHTAVIPNKIIPNIMLNLDLDNSNMQKEFFKKAVIKCVEKQEKMKKYIKNNEI